MDCMSIKKRIFVSSFGGLGSISSYLEISWIFTALSKMYYGYFLSHSLLIVILASDMKNSSDVQILVALTI